MIIKGSPPACFVLDLRSTFRVKVVIPDPHKADPHTRRPVPVTAIRVECSGTMTDAEILFTQRFAAPTICRRRRRRRKRGRPPLLTPTRLPARPCWEDPLESRIYTTLLAAMVAGDVRVVRRVEKLEPREALMYLTGVLLRRYRDRMCRARRGPPKDAASRMWQASRILVVVGRLAVDAAKARESTSRPDGVEAAT